ncbi:E3 ubiquitin-protein ligase Midline-1-like [Mizuhopecten yessoensis]|uniref:E3 ubiquitin-protein ligase Midline-1-like n=1 Tax=Mizuhopecten yessoensis TaxID=6573 RepID=UPI000B45E591|nr:E3 ubiquitin-protein ligase Midline-1-like [Mizuhopecten yessoensis]
MDTHLLDCPICLEQLHQPKSLPCLHSFCQKCLSTFITKDPSEKMAAATSFLCPVCRKITQPVNLSEGKEKWAQQFPTNGLINSLVKVTIDELRFCKPCEKKGKIGIPASVWCETLNIMFCDTCKVDHHDLVHEGCETANLSKRAEIMQRQDQVRCGEHTKRMTYFCEDHQNLGCSRCITINHRRCDEVTTTQEYYDKLKSDSRLDHWKTSLQKTVEAIELLIKEFDEQLQIMANDQATGLESLKDLRQKIDTRLDARQKNISDKLISFYKEEKEILQISIQKCKRLMSTIQNTITMSGNAVKSSDNVRTILLYQRGKAELESYKNMVTDMKKSFTSVRIKHIVDPSFLSLDEGILLSLGKVTIEKQPRRLPYGTTHMFTPLPDCRVKEAGKFNIKSSSDSSDCWAREVQSYDYIRHQNRVLKINPVVKNTTVNRKGYLGNYSYR